MGNLAGVAAGCGGNFKEGEGLQQEQREQGLDEEKVLYRHGQPCQGQPLEKPSSDGLPIDAEFFHQLVQEKERYERLYEEGKEIYQDLVLENNLQKQCTEKRDEELLGLRGYIRQRESIYEGQIHALKKKVKEYQQNCSDLSLKIEKAEHLHSQKFIADSSSYQDSAGTPPLLQLAADLVKDAIVACASELFSRIKKNSLPINCSRINIDSKENGQVVKVALQSFLCHALFKNFEDPFICASHGIPLFVKPARRRAHLFQVYKRCRDLDAGQMLKDEIEFINFFGVKESELCKELTEQLLRMDGSQKSEDIITSELCNENSNLHNKLLRLTKAVWLLHKLAFSFEPNAEIIRVGQDSVLDEDFMEDVAGDDDEDDEEETFAERYVRVRNVRFMCVPGFIVRHTIIKARVFCFGRSERFICSRMEDPSPMTLD